MNEENRKSFSRRQFLGTTVLAGIGMGAVLSSCNNSKTNEELGLAPILKGVPDGRKLKAGLVGTGNRGTGAALNFVSAGPNLEITALADVFQDKVDSCRKSLAKFNFEVPDKNCFVGFDAYKKLLETDIDVVLLATPPHFRPEHFKAAILAKKHVFLEKPIAVDPVGIRSVLATGMKATSMGLNVITGTQRRHSEDYIETYKQIANGAIGDLVSAKAFWNQAHVWYRKRKEGWTDMEYMVRNWNNFNWLCGDHILDTHIHNIDIINWFFGKNPIAAIGYGGRHRRLTGDQFDFFSIDFDFGNGVSSHSMSRQIDNCANNVGEVIMGTEGYTNCRNTIYNHDGSVKWKFNYPPNKDGSEGDKLLVPAYVQEHMHLVNAIRKNQYVNEIETTALSNLTAIMGREAAYTGKKITWDEIMNSKMRLGPTEYEMGAVDMEFNTPIPGTPTKG